MTREEFNDKYKQWIPEGWYGLEFDNEKTTEYLDLIMQDLIQIPGFELNQIKLKFGAARFYFETAWKRKELDAAIQYKIEERINKIVRGYDNWNQAKAKIEANSPYNDGWTKEFYEREAELNERMDVIGQNGNEGTHYEQDWMDVDYKEYYQKVKSSGMFFEWYPNLSGEWEKDKYWFSHERKFMNDKGKKD